jgi:hypothetical protein
MRLGNIAIDMARRPGLKAKHSTLLYISYSAPWRVPPQKRSIVYCKSIKSRERFTYLFFIMIINITKNLARYEPK